MRKNQALLRGSEMKYPIKQWYPIQITEQLYVDRIDRFAVGGLPWGRQWVHNEPDGRTENNKGVL